MPCFTGWENQYTLRLILGTELQYVSLHEQPTLIYIQFINVFISMLTTAASSLSCVVLLIAFLCCFDCF